MSSNRLRLNVTKTEFLWLGSPTRVASNPPSSIQITGSTIAPSKTVRSLGVLIDLAISFREQITGLTNTCYYHLRQLLSIRRSLSSDSSHALVRALILSRLDYCNGLLGGASAALLDQMNGVMRASARFILRKSRSSHITDEMNTRLHWLDIKARIDYKLCVTTFRCLNGLDWLLDISPDIALWCHPLLVGHTFVQRHREGWWYQHAVRRQSVQGRLRCRAPALGTIFQSKCTPAIDR